LSGGARRASNYNPSNIENPPHRSREGSLGASLPPASTDQVLRTQNISIPSDMVGVSDRSTHFCTLCSY
jgi:hypothetical protein